MKNLIMSFQNYTTSTFFTGIAPWVGFANYVSVFKDSLFKTTVINTVLFTAGSIAGQFVIGMALALFFKRRFPLSVILQARSCSSRGCSRSSRRARSGNGCSTRIAAC